MTEVRVSVNPAMSETSAPAPGILEAAQLFASPLQVQLDKKLIKMRLERKTRRTIFELQGTLIQVDGLSEIYSLVKYIITYHFFNTITRTSQAIEE